MPGSVTTLFVRLVREIQEEVIKNSRFKDQSCEASFDFEP